MHRIDFIAATFRKFRFSQAKKMKCLVFVFCVYIVLAILLADRGCKALSAKQTQKFAMCNNIYYVTNSETRSFKVTSLERFRLERLEPFSFVWEEGYSETLIRPTESFYPPLFSTTFR